MTGCSRVQSTPELLRGRATAARPGEPVVLIRLLFSGPALCRPFITTPRTELHDLDMFETHFSSIFIRAPVTGSILARWSFPPRSA